MELTKIQYTNALPLLPTRKMPKPIQGQGGYKVFLPNGTVQLVTKDAFEQYYELLESA